MKFYLIFYIFLENELQSLSFDTDFCKLPCIVSNRSVEHVMCTLKNDCSVGTECKVRTIFKFTREMKSFVLDMHNFYRNKVAIGHALGNDEATLPEGTDLLELIWDDELAYFAQCYANKCILQYDKCRQNSAKENIGQLIFIRVSVNPKTIEELITEMVEYVFYTSKHLIREQIEKHKENKHTKQFTQFAWARTNRVGCGMTKLLENLDAYFMVCNYGPAGNVEGERVYSIGMPCSNCPNHRTCGERYKGLCAATRDERNSLESIPAFLQISEREDSNSISSSSDDSTQRVNNETIVQINGDEVNISTSLSTSPLSKSSTTFSVTREIVENEEPHVLKIVEETTNSDNRPIDGVNMNMIASDDELKTADTEILPEIPIRICKIKRRNSWTRFDKMDSKTSSVEGNLRLENIYILLITSFPILM